jgi:hypothetical protein
VWIPLWTYQDLRYYGTHLLDDRCRRLAPLSTFRKRLRRLMRLWRECKQQRHRFRPIFKLAVAPPGPRLPDPVVSEEKSAAKSADIQPGVRRSATRRAAAVARGSGGCGGQLHLSSPHRVAAANALARQIVLEAGFEVFDPFSATFHASPLWLEAPSTSVEALGAHEVVSDLITQMLVNQLCNVPGDTQKHE